MDDDSTRMCLARDFRHCGRASAESFCIIKGEQTTIVSSYELVTCISNAMESPGSGESADVMRNMCPHNAWWFYVKDNCIVCGGVLVFFINPIWASSCV